MHQLIVSKSGNGPAYPHIKEDKNIRNKKLRESYRANSSQTDAINTKKRANYNIYFNTFENDYLSKTSRTIFIYFKINLT